MKLPFFFARRYFISARNTSAVNIISLVAMIGMAIGTMSLIVILTVFNGFESLVASLYNSFYPDIKVTAADGNAFAEPGEQIAQIRNIEEVAFVSSVLEENVILKYYDNQYIATLKGVDSFYIHVTDIDDNIIRGTYRLTDGDLNYTVLGSGVEIGLDVNVFDELSIIDVYAPKRQEGTYKSTEFPFVVGKIIPAGSYAIQQELDSKYILASIRFTRELMDYDKDITALEIKLHNAKNADKIVRQIEKLFGNELIVQNRYQQNEFLYKVMNTERWIVYLLGSVIIFILGFNITGSLWMLAIEKKKDMFYLRSMGAGSNLIVKIFLSEGMIISLTGAVIGACFALIIVLLQQQFGFIKLQGSGSFVVEAYPTKLILTDFLLIFGTVVFITLIMSILPAINSAKNLMIVKEE